MYTVRIGTEVDSSVPRQHRKADQDRRALEVRRHSENAQGRSRLGALPDGLYYIEWYLAGKRRRDQAGRTASQALEAQRRKNHDLEGRQLRVLGFEHAGEEARRLPLHLAVERYLTQVETLKKPNTMRKYRCVLNRFVEHFKERPNIDAIANEDIDDFIITLMRKHHMSANTVIHNTIIIAQFLRRQGRPNMTKQVQLPGAIRILPREYTEEDLTRFLKACDNFEKALFSTFLLTGVREQEMVHLVWSDLNFKLRTLRVTVKRQLGFYPKRWEEREIPITMQLAELLREHPRRMGTEFVFPSPTGNREQNMLLRCKEVAARAELDPTRFDVKTFRSTYATRMLREGFDVRTVQAWMGHKSLETTMRYLVPATEVHDRLDRLLLPGSAPERKGPVAAEGPKLLEASPPAKQPKRR